MLEYFDYFNREITPHNNELFFSLFQIDTSLVNDIDVWLPASSAFLFVETDRVLSLVSSKDIKLVLAKRYGSRFKKLTEREKDDWIDDLLNENYFFQCVLIKDFVTFCLKEETLLYFTNIFN